MLEKIKEMIAEQLNVDAAEITEATSFKDDLGADSLDLFELVMALEEEYGVEIPSEHLEKITTVGAVMDYLKSKGVEAYAKRRAKYEDESYRTFRSGETDYSGRYGLGGRVSSGSSGLQCRRLRNHRCS